MTTLALPRADQLQYPLTRDEQSIYDKVVSIVNGFLYEDIKRENRSGKCSYKLIVHNIGNRKELHALLKNERVLRQFVADLQEIGYHVSTRVGAYSPSALSPQGYTFDWKGCIPFVNTIAVFIEWSNRPTRRRDEPNPLMRENDIDVSKMLKSAGESLHAVADAIRKIPVEDE